MVKMKYREYKEQCLKEGRSAQYPMMTKHTQLVWTPEALKTLMKPDSFRCIALGMSVRVCKMGDNCSLYEKCHRQVKGQ